MNADEVKSIIVIVIGLAAICFGILGKDFYYTRGYGGLTNKKAPVWFGRTMFLTVGIVFILFGFAHLFFGVGTIR